MKTEIPSNLNGLREKVLHVKGLNGVWHRLLTHES